MFFFMIRPPPLSTLFPSRRSSDLAGRPSKTWWPGRRPYEPDLHRFVRRAGNAVPERQGGRGEAARAGRARSEEHTSELQSRGHLVCRLLLEIKKCSTVPSAKWFCD